MEIIYLLNSGFLLRMGDTVLIFDDYRDPAGAVERELAAAGEAYIFASHAHFDHFDGHILKYAAKTSRYFLSDDIRQTRQAQDFPAEKTTYLKTYDSYAAPDIRITTFDSTDLGTSFLVEKDGWRIFHAGDLNWWHWKGDTPENLRLAEEGFRSELARLSGEMFDVAFFPVDSRLEECRTMGVNEFVQNVQIRQLVTMHHCGDVWTAPPDFPGDGREMAVWSPPVPGAGLQVRK